MGNMIEDVIGLVLVLMFIPLCLGLYFLPTIVASRRHVPNAGPLVIVNVFLGWTLLGWVIALAWAMRDVPDRSPVG
jgi:hypothetical protein